MNVALTRARFCLFVLGHADTLNSNLIWGNYVDSMVIITVPSRVCLRLIRCFFSIDFQFNGNPRQRINDTENSCGGRSFVESDSISFPGR